MTQQAQLRRAGAQRRAVARPVLAAILAQRDGRPFSHRRRRRQHDARRRSWPGGPPARCACCAGRGGGGSGHEPGVREAGQPIIGLVDQDVVLKPGWTAAILEPLLTPGVGAVQGCFVTDPQAPKVARVAGMDLEQRYAAIGEGPTNHVCTGNSAYRAEALHEAGLFDESFGYGYDNDISYRLMKAGYGLRFCPGAKSIHRWRETVRGYLVQQYGQGYGRLDIVWKHPAWVAGDAVSPSMMMAHAPLMTAAMAAAAGSLVLRATGLPWRLAVWLAALTLGGLALERLVAGVRAAVRHRDAAGLLFVPLHLLRDAAWALAIVVWSARRIAGRDRRPSHSMGRE
jgi:hypothetical protein